MNCLLEKYIPVAELVARTFGDCCEVVLHDLSEPQKSVAYTVNNHVTGRTVGQSFDHLITKVLLSQDFRDDCAANYMACDIPGKIIKSSTAIIRDENNAIIGAFCVNVDITAASNMNVALSGFLGQAAHSIEKAPESGVEVIGNVMEIVDDIIGKVISSKDVTSLTRENKLDILSFLYDKGIFLIKGTIEKVSEKLGISRVTVYSYLDEIKKRGQA